jgi:hypothetical protein
MRHYSAKSFFRQIPNALLKRYFSEKGLLEDIDFSALPEFKPNILFSHWLNLAENQRSFINAEFRDIFELSCEKGFKAIIDEAQWHSRDNVDELSSLIKELASLSNHFERAMVTFLDHNRYWKGATRFHHADTLPYWRKRNHMRHQPAAVDPASINELADLIRKYFHHTEGRGNNCVIEPFRRGDLDYFFAYPEDYSQQSIEWVNGNFDKRPHNPAFEVVFVYSQKEGSLDLNFRGSSKAVEPLQSMFAQAILKLDELPPNPKDTRVYDLSPLLKKNFEFTYELGSGIQQVAVQKLRLSSRIKKGDRITLEADTADNRNAVYELMEKMKNAVPLHLYNITQAELAVRLSANGDKAPKVVKVRITHPNSCSLKYEEMDLKLRDMLSTSGLEPREINTAIEPTDSPSQQ